MLLATAVITLVPSAATALALAITTSTIANLVSNAGIPTLIVRSMRSGASRETLLAMATCYAALTTVASLSVGGLIWLLANSLLLATAAAALLIGQSLLSGYEYWYLGSTTTAHDSFVRRAATLQACLSLTAPIALLVSHSAEMGLLVAAFSYIIPVFLVTLRHTKGLLAAFARNPFTPAQWWFAAASVGAGSTAAAVYLSADVYVLSAIGMPAEDIAGYRLAMLCVSFAVGLAPVNLFVLADASAGHQIAHGRLATLAVLGACAVAGSSLLLPLLSTRLAATAETLLLLSPVAAARLLLLVRMSELNGLGRHWLVVICYGVGLVGWVGIGTLASLIDASPLGVALMHNGLEGSLAALGLLLSKTTARRGVTIRS